ncbi:MAG: adenylate kinase [Spirochaetaceae bacterium]|nr:adenylate kinase [Spirochaetaceae bacterium]
MNLIFLGPPGAGKGTLAGKVVELLQIPQISTGNIFRAAMASGSELGNKVKAIVESGKLVDDDTTIALVKERLTQADVAKGYILDGFPRTIPQAEALEKWTIEVGNPISHVINFDISDDKVLQRLGGRLVCKKCGYNWHKTFNPPSKAGVCDKCGGEVYTRPDDSEESIKKRLEVYRNQTEPLIGFYRGKGLLVDIDANPEVDQMFVNFKEALNLL